MTIENNVPNDNIISYDSGEKIFEHDKDRGKWSSKWDFLAACIAHFFSVVNFSIIPQMLMNEGGVLFIIFYLLGSLMFTIPIIFIQSFWGQFSSTGFISAYRIAPMFKGIGYVILCINLVAVCYHSVFTAIPLIYLLTSIGIYLPWMSCSNSWNSNLCTEVTTYTSVNTTDYIYKIRPAEEYFTHELASRQSSYWSISWKLLATTITIWILLGVIISTKVKIIGQILRYFTISMLIILIIIFLRVLCLPNSFTSILQFLIPKTFSSNSIFNVTTLFLSALIFGSGWGTILTLASYNDFKTNIGKTSIIICVSHFIVITLSGLIHVIIAKYVHKIYTYPRFQKYGTGIVYTMLPFLFGHLEVPQMWSVIYFLMLFLGEFSSCIILMLSIVTAIFDEFVKLRNYKNTIILVLLSCLALFSIGYTFRNGIYLVNSLISLTGISQMFICLIELLVVVWVYGRLRFQRDIKFMTGQQYSTWKFFIIRFLTPIFTVIACIFFILHFIFNLFTLPEVNAYMLVLTITMKFLPILIIPIYIIIRLSATTGTFLNRFRRLCKPNDWYPVDPIHRQKYEEFLGNPDITHQLVVMDEAELDDNQEL